MAASEAVSRRYVETVNGQIHVASSGSGRPVVLLHQTPRSWREYAAVLPLLSPHARAIAIDTPGYGQSDPPKEWSIAAFADGVLAALDAMQIESPIIVGNHTGAVIALELASRPRANVESLVLCGMPFVDGARQRRASKWPPIDHVISRSDGAHLLDLWSKRISFYRGGEEHLLNAFVGDALSVLDNLEDGHKAVNAFRMEEKIPRVRCPVLLVCGEEDQFSLPDQARLGELFGCVPQIIPEAGVPLPEQEPRTLVDLILVALTRGRR